MLKVLVAGMLAFGVLAGCTGSTVPAFVRVEPTPNPACTSVLIVGNLISPATGATGVSTTVGSISFSIADARMLAGTLTLVPLLGGTTVQGGPISGTADNAASPVPVLQSQTRYAAQVTATIPGAPCNPQGSFLGTFTTGS